MPKDVRKDRLRQAERGEDAYEWDRQVQNYVFVPDGVSVASKGGIRGKWIVLRWVGFWILDSGSNEAGNGSLGLLLGRGLDRCWARVVLGWYGNEEVKSPVASLRLTPSPNCQVLTVWPRNGVRGARMALISFICPSRRCSWPVVLLLRTLPHISISPPFAKLKFCCCCCAPNPNCPS